MKRLLFFLVLAVGWAAADTQIASDNFTRANGTLGSNWTSDNGTWAISSNTAIVSSTSGYAIAHWSGSSFTADQYATYTVNGAWVAAPNMGAGVRLSASKTGYFVACTSVASGACAQFRVYRQDAAGPSLLESFNLSSPYLAPGTQVTLKISGSALSVWTGATQIDTGVTDSTYTTGSPGMLASVAYTSTNGFTYWAGGNVGSSTPQAYTASASDSLLANDSLNAAHGQANSASTSDAVWISDQPAAIKSTPGQRANIAVKVTL